jgi:hypothetical protein
LNPANGAIGGYTPTPSNYATASIIPLVLNNASTTFYWTIPGTYKVTYKYTSATGTFETVDAEFVVDGPKNPRVVVVQDKTVLINNKLMRFGSNNKHPGISFSASAEKPTGYANIFNFQWVQYIEFDNAIYTANGHAKSCTFGVGLDTEYPFMVPPAAMLNHDSFTNDNPDEGLDDTYTNIRVSDVFDMYLMWSSGLQDSIPVPLGKVSWSWLAAARQNTKTHIWSLTSDPYPPFLPFFVEGHAYPTWDHVVDPNVGGQKCD